MRQAHHRQIYTVQRTVPGNSVLKGCCLGASSTQSLAAAPIFQYEFTSRAAPWHAASRLGLRASILPTASSKRFPYAFSKCLLAQYSMQRLRVERKLCFMYRMSKIGISILRRGVFQRKCPCGAALAFLLRVLPQSLPQSLNLNRAAFRRLQQNMFQPSNINHLPDLYYSNQMGLLLSTAGAFSGPYSQMRQAVFH